MHRSTLVIPPEFALGRLLNTEVSNDLEWAEQCHFAWHVPFRTSSRGVLLIDGVCNVSTVLSRRVFSCLYFIFVVCSSAGLEFLSALRGSACICTISTSAWMRRNTFQYVPVSAIFYSLSPPSLCGCWYRFTQFASRFSRNARLCAILAYEFAVHASMVHRKLDRARDVGPSRAADFLRGLGTCGG